MRAYFILAGLFAMAFLNSQLAQASNSNPETSIPSSTPPGPPPGPAPNPINELIAQLQTLSSDVAALNLTIHNEAQVLADRWNQSNVEFKQGTEMVDERLSPISLLKIGFYIGLPVAIVEAVALPVVYCIAKRSVGYQKIINDSV